MYHADTQHTHAHTATAEHAQSAKASGGRCGRHATSVSAEHRAQQNYLHVHTPRLDLRPRDSTHRANDSNICMQRMSGAARRCGFSLVTNLFCVLRIPAPSPRHRRRIFIGGSVAMSLICRVGFCHRGGGRVCNHRLHFLQEFAVIAAGDFVCQWSRLD